jgi:type 1 glutamine amidotransferase
MKSLRLGFLTPLVLVPALPASAPTAPGPHVLFIAGPASHGPGEHEHPAGCALLAAALSSSDLSLTAAVSEGWPSPEALATASTLVLYSDGLEQHVARDHLDALRAHTARGGGLVVLHFALEASPGDLADFLLETLGGRFEAGWSVNPVWDLEAPLLAEHPITRGVAPFALKEEFYYHLRLRETIVPILRAHPPLDSLREDGPRSGNAAVRRALEAGEPQVLAWAHEAAGIRAFGYTGGHYHLNWSQEDVRRLVLNAIVWTAGLEVPPGGVASSAPAIPRYLSIDEAIARGDLEDVLRHLAADPATLHTGRNPRLSPLQQAILRGQEPIALALLEAGANPDQTDGSSRTLLHLAVERSLAEAATALLRRGAPPNELDRIGWTPLHHAAAEDKVPLVRALLAGGADPMARSARGGTPLHEAAASGGPAILRLLLEAGTDPSIVSHDGVTALDLARSHDNTAAREILEALAAEPSSPAPPVTP